MQRLKRIVEDVTHGQRRHAFTVQLVNISTHIQQQVDHIIVAVHLAATGHEAFRETTGDFKQRLSAKSFYFAATSVFYLVMQSELCYCGSDQSSVPVGIGYIGVDQTSLEDL